MSNNAAHRRTGVRRAIADFAKLTVLALVVLAAGTGLHFQLGFAVPAALLAGVALMVAMALSYIALARARRARGRADIPMQADTAFEGARVAAQLVERVEAVLAQLDGLGARLAKLERSAIAPSTGGAKVLGGGAELSEKAAQVDRLAAEVDRLSARLDAYRSQSDIKDKENQERITAELRTLERLIRALAEQVAGWMAAGANEAPIARRPDGPGAGAEAKDDSWSSAITWSVGRSTSGTGSEDDPHGAAASRTGDADLDRAAAAVDAEQLTAAVLAAIRRSVEANAIDLYLQPIVTLPQRRVRYYEALTRIRDGAGNVLLPSDYLDIAQSAGLMPLIDNVMLSRSVQVLKRLSERSSARGVFCNLSLHSLLDPEFFPEFIAFMEQNQPLAAGLHFEFSQRMIATCGPIENESLQSLSALGFRFALDQVHDLDIDFQSLHERGFRYIKIEADLFLHRMAESGARIHAADMRAYLDRHGLQLVIEKIEDERTLADVLDLDAALGQGYLFSEPRPVRPEVFASSEDAAAA